MAITNKPTISVGDRFNTNCYGFVEVIEYVHANKIKVRFDIDGYERFTTSGNLRKGKVKNPTSPTTTHARRNGVGTFVIGDRFQNSKVLFDSGYSVTVVAQQIRTKQISDNFSPSLYKGFLGDVSFYEGRNIAKTDEYKHWNGMMTRCFDEKYKEQNPTYYGVTCCEEWLDFSKFANWCRSQKSFGSGEKLNLEKDVISKGNKFYHPDLCELVPYKINNLFVKADASRGKYPIGVYFCNTNNKISACVREDSKNVFLGYFTNEVDAFMAYKKKKEEIIVKYANRYKHLLSEKYYNSLLYYEVEITD